MIIHCYACRGTHPHPNAVYDCHKAARAQQARAEAEESRVDAINKRLRSVAYGIRKANRILGIGR